MKLMTSTIADRRKALGWSRRDLAEHAQLSRWTVRDIELGRNGPQWAIDHILKALAIGECRAPNVAADYARIGHYEDDPRAVAECGGRPWRPARLLADRSYVGCAAAMTAGA